MSKEFDDFMDDWRNRLTALGGILGCKPLPEQHSCGTIHAEGEKAHRAPNAASGLQDLHSAGQSLRRGEPLRDGEAAFDSRKTKLTAQTKAEVSEYQSSPAGIKYDGNLLPSMTAMVTGFVDKLAKFYSPCPQGKDCAGDQKHNRIFACDHCSFVGCCACLDQHESAGHESDSSTAREYSSGLRLIDGGKQ